jgi:hypothetical protein
MKLHLIASGVTALSFLLLSIPQMRAVGPGLVFLSAAIIGVIAFLASLCLAKLALRMPVTVAFALLCTSWANIYFLGYSIAFVTGATWLLAYEGGLRFVLSAVLTAAATPPMVHRWWSIEERS